ncbi:MAG: 50S ribosomal protein L10 [Gammaproteobacteria bacterium]|nr:MAG: 50S ribosomal protein L10 [Gammaproteobacteria bacterium]UCH41971.1 MAG: 50S ribosomal protein L10 [Gammaproteobacteria bacterium]
MPLTLEQKQNVVSEVAQVAAQAHSVIAAEYQGLTVGEMTALRVKARESNVQMRVVKNTLAKRAFDGTDYACMNDALEGQMVYAFSMDEPGGAARVIKDYAKDNEKLVVKLIAFGGELLDPSEIKRLASMPTYDQAISTLMAVMKAPLDKLARTMNEVPSKLTRTVAAIRDQKQ